MTPITAGRPAATVMLEEVLSAMTRSVPSSPPCQRSRRSALSAGRAQGLLAPLQDVRRAPGAEMPDVDALGAADPDPALQRLVHMAQPDVPGPGLLDRRQQRLAPPFHPPGDGVVEQLGNRRRDVRAQHVDLTDSLDLGGVFLVVELVRSPVGG